MTRGPDYAYELSESQRRTLDRLLQRVAAGGLQPVAAEGVHRRRRSLVGIALTAAAVATIALATALVPLSHQPPPISPATATAIATPAPSTEDVLSELSRAAGRTSRPTPATQHTIVVVATQKQDVCASTGYALVTTVTPSRDSGALPGVSLEVDRAAVPPAARPWLPCVGPPLPTDRPGRAQYQKVFEGSTPGEADHDWPGFLIKLRAEGPLLPDLNDPRTLPSGINVATLSPDPAQLSLILDKTAYAQPAGEAGWWTAVARLFASSLCSPGLRSAAFGLTADPTRAVDAEIVTVRAVDMLGRTGVTLRVPYGVGNVATYAELTFDTTTGALLQRAVQAPAGQTWTTVVTAYE